MTQSKYISGWNKSTQFIYSGIDSADKFLFKSMDLDRYIQEYLFNVGICYKNLIDY